jgi:hypothetical protein
MSDGLETSRRIEQLEAFFRERSQPAWADRLRDAVAGGATGTESLFRVGSVLRELVRSGAAKEQGCERDVKDLAKEIEGTLKRI